MDIHAAAVAGLLLACVLANLPFAWPRLKPGWRLAALAGFYGVWIATMLALQARAALAHPMGWQAWSVSAAFFAVVAFPGVVWRYLWRR